MKRMTITVEIKGLEPIVEAVNKLAQALGTRGLGTELHESESQAALQTAQQTPAQAAPYLAQGTYYQTPAVPAQQNPGSMIPTSPVNQLPLNPQQQASQGGMPPAAPAAGQLPTTAAPQSYTQDQIAVAMTGLVDRGMQPAVTQILAQFGAMSLQQIAKEQYPALAAELRKAGANI